MNPVRSMSILATCVLAGCATLPDANHARPIETDQQLVERAWPYAQLAYNVYHRESIDPDARPFVLPKDFTPLGLRYGNDEIGLALETVERSGSPPELIFVFRGTEGDPSPKNCDWRHGNFAYQQQGRAVRMVKDYIRDYPNHQLVFVGHSLGGAIATQLSFHHPGSRTYIFNPSPMFRPTGTVGDPTQDRQRRLSIVNRFEFLYIARAPRQEATQVYLPVNCGGGINPVTRHSMFRLATCLTKRAADGGQTLARQSYLANGSQFTALRMKIDPTNASQLCPKGRPIAPHP